MVKIRMNRSSVNNLIDELSNDLKPIKPLPHVALVTIIWVITLLVLGLISAYILNAAPKSWHLPTSGLGILNWTISIFISLFALSHTFLSQIPGYKFSRFILAFSLILWLTINLFSLVIPAQPIKNLGHGTPCYFFVIATGIPMILSSIFFLKRYTFLHLMNTLQLLSLSIIFLSFSLLSLCHSSQLSINDFLMHLLAALTIAVLNFTLGIKYIGLKK